MANNSISQIIRQFLEMNQNSIENFEKISEAITTDKKTVSLDLFDEQGNLKTVQVPAFGYLKREIERLDTNFKSLSGLSSGDATVKMPDGTFRQITKSKLKTPAKSVTSISAPTTFVTKTNNFFESFLNPLLQVQLDVNGQVPTNTEKIKLARYIIDSNDANSVDWFDTNIKGTDTLDVNQMLSDFATNNIRYIVDEEVIDAPVRSSQYNGGFDVSKIRTTQRNITVDGVTQTKTIKLYTVNTFSYNDAEKTMTETESLKVGDEVLVNSGNNSTKYRVVSLNADTLEVELLLLEGYESVKVGLNQLKIYKGKEAYDAIDIAVGFDERMVAFIKPVDAESNLEAEQWSPGTAFYTNDLIITREDGEVQTLANFYKDEVADFGQMIKALKEDSIPPSILGVTPDAPTLEPSNFKVTQVNTHLTESETFNRIKSLNANKVSAESSIKRFDEDITSKKAAIATKKYSSTVEKDRDSNELINLINQRTTDSNLYTSLVSEIKTIAETTNISNIAPKYRVRGFWNIPDAKLAAGTLPQKIVQFKVQYRYLSTDGTPAKSEQIELGADGVTGSFSNWTEVAGKVRKRSKDPVTGKYFWEAENVENSQEININQLNIPIQSGETVEFRVKSISEAGWPSNPLESEWSKIVRVPFPNGLVSTNSVVNLVDSNTSEIAKVKLIEELQSVGIYKHVNDSFSVGDKYFAHTATTITSGFVTDEQVPISIYDKLLAMQLEIDTLKAKIETILGELVVKLQKEDGTTETLQNNTVKSIFAGYYTDEVSNLDVKKGHIVTKTFKLILENSQATPLELVSRISGDRNKVAYNSSDSTNNGFGVAPNAVADAFIASDTYYKINGKYDLVPTLYQNTTSADLTQTYFNEAPYQSGQLRGQYAYSRFKNIANDTELYVTNDINTSNDSGELIYEYSVPELDDYNNIGVDPVGYIFKGTWDNPSANVYTPEAGNIIGFNLAGIDYNNSVLLHIDHPELNKHNGAYSDVKSTIAHAKTLNVNGQQTAYYYDAGLNRTVKMAFEPNDQYLLGGNSCGAYLFMSPLSIDQLRVNADNTSGEYIIGMGSGNGVSIDISFQYRMTDYSGSSVSGVGYIGGNKDGLYSNLTYSKRIGIDILDSYDNQFSIDLEVFAKYKP